MMIKDGQCGPIEPIEDHNILAVLATIFHCILIFRISKATQSGGLTISRIIVS